MILNTHVTILARDMDRSISFYQSLGFELEQRWGDHYAQLKAPGIEIGIHPAGASQGPAGSGNVSIGFTIDNWGEGEALLDSLGIPVDRRQEEGGQFLHFADPDGTSLYFIQPTWE